MRNKTKTIGGVILLILMVFVTLGIYSVGDFGISKVYALGEGDEVAPVVSSVSVPSDGTYKVGDNLVFTVDFTEAITVTGTPGISITVGSTMVYADYVSGDGTSALEFRYTVKTGDLDSDGIIVSGMQLNGGTIRDMANNDATLELNNVGSTIGVRVNGTAPTVSAVEVLNKGTRKVEANLEFLVVFSEDVIITGKPRLALIIGNHTVYADFTTNTINGAPLFFYKVKAGDEDSDGVEVVALDLNGATIKNTIGNDAVLTLKGIADTSQVRVDGVAPTVSSVSVPSDGTYKVGDNLDFTVNYSEEVTVTGSPRISIIVGTTTVYADYVSGDGTSALEFRYTVKTGDLDSDGITVSGMQLNGGTIRDMAGNNASLMMNNMDSTIGVRVNGLAPTVASVLVPTNGTRKVGGTLDFTVAFSEKVIVTGTPRLALIIGNQTVYADYTHTFNERFVSFSYTVKAGDEDSDGVAVGALDLNGATIQSTIGNDASLTLKSIADTSLVRVDGVAPTVSSVSVPSDGTYKVGDNLDFTVNYSEEVTVTGTPGLAIHIGSTTVYANYVSGSGTSALTFQYTIKDGDQDSDGITVLALSLEGGSIRDAAGNNAVLTLNNVASTSGVKVNEVAPPVITPPSSPISTPKTEGKLEKDQKRNENAPDVSLNDSIEDLKSKLLSTEELAQIATGKDAKVILKIEDISATVSEKDKQQIEEKLAAEQQNTADSAMLYIDISLFKQIGEGEETQITKTNGKISISIEVPENMRSTKEGIERSYHVIRIHDGVAELLEGSYDPINHLFTFETDRFSTYALTYRDVNTSPDQGKDNTSDKITAYNDFNHLRLKAKADKTSQKLSFAKVSDADGYLIYGAQCGKDLKLLAEVGGNITSYTVKNLKQSTYYKYQVKAYKIIDGEKVIIATSRLIRSVTTSKTYGNPTKITTKITSITLSVGKTKKVTFEVVLPKNKKMKDFASLTRFETTDKKIATVDGKGKITAKAKGTCYLYIYAQNGVYIKLKVTVK